MDIVSKSTGPKSTEIFRCEICDFTTSRNSHYVRHIATRKHKMETEETFGNQKSTAPHICNCGKKYKNRAGLWKHRQTCNFQESILEKEEKEEFTAKEFLEKEDFMQYLIKENSEFKDMLLEQNKMIVKMCENSQATTVYNNNNNNNCNNHNKTFNLNMFLNETCKDAMNITDFVQSLKIQLSDLENVGKVGFVNGITDIIVKNLKNMDITQRPVHCTDSKREVLYVKDENKWEKEGEDNVKLRKAIKHVAFKNTKMLPEFRKQHPDCGKSESKYADQYNKLIVESMGGKGDNDVEKENKIIRNIAKQVVLEK